MANPNPRRIFFVTAARSEYDILMPVIREAQSESRLAPELIVAGAHLSPFHGMGIDRIRGDGFSIAGQVESLIASESPTARSLSFAQLVEGLTRLLSGNRPDILCVAGDREEPLATAIVGNLMGIPVAHLHGGDRCLAVTVDEVLRHAISKLSHLHFVATTDHRERLIRMGENPERVWVSGAPGIDLLRQEPEVANDSLQQKYGIDLRKPFFLLIYHPSPLAECATDASDFIATLEGVRSLGHPIVCSYPNFDPGNIAIRRAIDAARSAKFVVSQNLPREDFITLYRHCAAIVGNSSSIVIESGFLKVAGVLVGHRQDLREIGPNVLRVSANADAVRGACERALNDAAFRAAVGAAPSLYGDGHAAPRITHELAQIELNSQLLQKTLAY